MQLNQINEKIVSDLPVPTKGYEIHWAGGLELQKKATPPGFGVRVTATGTRSFILFYRAKGKPHVATIGRHGALKVLEAIVKADKLYKDLANDRVEDTRPARTRRAEDKDKPKAKTIGDLLDEYIAEQRAATIPLRSLGQIEGVFKRHVKPDIGDIGIYDIDREHVQKMLRKIGTSGSGAHNGKVAADRTLAYVRSAFNWYAPKDKKFTSPIVPRMSQTKPKKHARQRVLANDEIKDLWAALAIVENVPAHYPRYIKALLLTATRRTELAAMHSRECIDKDLWIIPGSRFKNTLDHTVPLSAAARELIGEIKQGSGFVFSTDGGKTAFSGFSKSKAQLDKAIAKVRAAAGKEPMENWTLHDLRRTASTLLPRAGISDEVGNACLGHVKRGIEGTYNRHGYDNEKRDAFERLAALVASIVAVRSVHVLQ